MNAKKWLKIWFYTIITIGVIPCALLYIYLESNFENNTYTEIVDRQIKNNSIYGTAMNQNTYSYKLELIKKTKPTIIALGSSRVMPFRKEDFTTTFINAGGSMNYLNEGYEFLDDMYQFHKPKYIILGLDFWWFNDNFYQPHSFPYHKNTGKGINLNKLSKTILALYNSKISISTYKNIFSNDQIYNKYTNYDNLGFDAISTSDGYRSDGSRFYSKTNFGLEKSIDEKFSDTLNRIINGNQRFEYGNNLSKTRLVIFNKILKLIRDNNTKVILFIPPLANTISKAMKGYSYNYIDKFRTYISNFTKVEHYDYHILSTITENDCECLDGVHGGEVVYSRILKDMYNKNSLIAKYINISSINKNIDEYKGDTLIITNNNLFKKHEIDFLKLGCKK